MPPAKPALPAPAGHPGRPQNGQTENIAYKQEIPNHHPNNRNIFPVITRNLILFN
jgi:hypothetical protein